MAQDPEENALRSVVEGESDSDTQIDLLRNGLQQMPYNMTRFSGYMLVLDKQLQVSIRNKEFKKIYEDTRRDSVVFRKSILPLANETIGHLMTFFDNFVYLNYDEWAEDLDYILEDVQLGKYRSQVLVEAITALLAPLKARKEDAGTAIGKMKMSIEHYKKQVKHYRDQAEQHRIQVAKNTEIGAWTAIFTAGLSMLVVEAVNDPLEAEAELGMVKAESSQRQMMIVQAAVESCKEIMIPALEAFIKGLSTCAGFFNVTEKELGRMQGEGEKAKSQRRPRRLYFKKMQGIAKDLNVSCKMFYYVVPTVVAELDAIRTSSCDENYVDEWEKNELKKIKEKYGKPMVQSITDNNVS